MLEMLRDMKTASKRAVALTRELLAFSRRRMLRFDPVDLNEVLTRLRPHLGRVLGPHVQLVLELAPDLPRLMADADSLEWMLNHLCVNARDAMPQGGRWTLRTDWAPAGEPSGGDAAGGPCVCLSATDTGVGMPPEVVARVFDPFFTTKDVGQGNGLGLAAVYGLVKQQQGRVEVASQPGQGSTFRILLPLAGPSAELPP